MIDNKPKTQCQEEWEKIVYSAPIALNRKQVEDIYKIGYATAMDQMYSLIEKYEEIDKEILDVLCSCWNIDDFSMTYYLNLVKRREWQK